MESDDKVAREAVANEFRSLVVTDIDKWKQGYAALQKSLHKRHFKPLNRHQETNAR